MSTMTDDLTKLIAERRPGYSLERSFYVDDEIYREDLTRVFFRTWLFAGAAARVRAPGDFFTVEVGKESVIIVRGDDGEIHALSNVCRHRGSRVCTAEAGHKRVLVCPYHQWVYSTCGELTNARLAPDGFDLSSHGLRKLHVREMGGLIFFSFAVNSPAGFDEFERVMSPRLAPHMIESADVAHIARYQVHANWKLVEENSRECYHCGAGHPQYTRAVAFAAAIGLPDMRAEVAAFENEGLRRLEELGIPTAPIPFADNSWYHYRRFFMRPGMLTESMDGKPVAPLMAEKAGWDGGVFAVVTLPNLLLEASPDYVITLRILPEGPALTQAEVTWLVKAGTQPDIDRLTEFWRLTSEQDWKLCEDNHAGVDTMAYTPGPYATSETGVEKFILWYLKQMSEIN